MKFMGGGLDAFQFRGVTYLVGSGVATGAEAPAVKELKVKDLFRTANSQEFNQMFEILKLQGREESIIMAVLAQEEQPEPPRVEPREVVKKTLVISQSKTMENNYVARAQVILQKAMRIKVKDPRLQKQQKKPKCLKLFRKQTKAVSNRPCIFRQMRLYQGGKLQGGMKLSRGDFQHRLYTVSHIPNIPKFFVDFQYLMHFLGSMKILVERRKAGLQI